MESGSVSHGGLPWWQPIKLVVYVLLLVNFGVYIFNDWTVASHTAQADWTLINWAGAFATTLDESAWFLLLLLFELETYLLADEAFTRARVRLMHSLRIVCYFFIAHTVYAFADYAIELFAVVPAAADSLCDLVDRDLAYTFNLSYVGLDPVNCGTLSPDSVFYLIQDGTLVTDRKGLQLERELALVDVFEVVAWLGILFAIELTVRLQDRGITGGPALRSARMLKLFLYGLLWFAAAYWLYRGHWVFAWDEALWILGFIAIDMNIDEWRAEINEEKATPDQDC